MANVLLVNPPMIDKEGKYFDGYQGVRPKLPPLGLAYIAAVLEKSGHNVRIVEGMTEITSPEEIAKISDAFDVIGITSITFLAKLAHNVASAVKNRNRKMPVVMGGPHASVVPHDVLQDENIDYVVIGEGEKTFLELVNAFELGWSTLTQLKGVAYRSSDKIVVAEQSDMLEDLSEMPLPARHLLPMHLYRSSEVRARRHPALHMMSSRGCPYSCSFCSNQIMHRRKLRMYLAERVVEEMEVLIRDFGAKEIHFWDDCFVFDKERVYKICDIIEKRKINIPWDCEATAGRVDMDMLKRMRSAGCFTVSYGIEVGSDERLKSLNKGWLNRKKIKEVVSLTRRAGLRTRGYFMFGFVGETLKEMEETIKFSKELDLDFATFSILVPLPGTEDYGRAREEGQFDPFYWRDKVLSEISFPMDVVYVPSGITKDELLTVHRKAYRKFYFRPRTILRRLLDLRSPSNLVGSLKGALRLIHNN